MCQPAPQSQSDIFISELILFKNDAWKLRGNFAKKHNLSWLKMKELYSASLAGPRRPAEPLTMCQPAPRGQSEALEDLRSI